MSSQNGGAREGNYLGSVFVVTLTLVTQAVLRSNIYAFFNYAPPYLNSNRTRSPRFIPLCSLETVVKGSIWHDGHYQSSPMGTLKGKVHRLATVGLDTSSTIQSMSFFRRMAMLLGNTLNGCQSWIMVALGRTPFIRSVLRYRWWIAVWSRRTGGASEVDKDDWTSPATPSSDRRSLTSSALKRSSRIPWGERGRTKSELSQIYNRKHKMDLRCAFLPPPVWLWCGTSGNPLARADHHGSGGSLWHLGTWIWPAQSKSAAELLPHPFLFLGGQHEDLQPAWSPHHQSHTPTPEQSAEGQGGDGEMKQRTYTVLCSLWDLRESHEPQSYKVMRYRLWLVLYQTCCRAWVYIKRLRPAQGSSLTLLKTDWVYYTVLAVLDPEENLGRETQNQEDSVVTLNLRIPLETLGETEDKANCLRTTLDLDIDLDLDRLNTHSECSRWIQNEILFAYAPVYRLQIQCKKSLKVQNGTVKMQVMVRDSSNFEPLKSKG